MSRVRVSTAALGAAGLIVALLLAPTSLAAAAETKAFAFTSDFSTGSLSVANLATRAVALDVASVNSDAVLRYFGGALYVVNRAGVTGDNIQVIDPSTDATLRQFSVGAGSNPQDIVFVSSTKAYVSRYGMASLLVVNPSNANGLPQSTISLAGFADSDGLPEMARMIRIDHYLFVACQRLTSFAASNPSVIVVIDTNTNSVVDVDPDTPGVQGIALTLRNPVSAFEYDRVNGRLMIGCAGNFGALDGGVEAIDPYRFVSDGVVITEAELGGDINDIAWDSPTHAYALVGDGSLNRLVVWNPSTGLKVATPFTANGGFSLPDMEIDDRGELYVCKNPSPATSTDRPGLLVFSTATDALLAGPLDTGLPPIVVTFDHATDAVLDVPATPAASDLALRGPWPNPTRGSTRIALRLTREVEVEATVLDLSGRQVRRLARERFASGERTLSWDLNDEAGRAVGDGVYFIQVRAGTWSTSRQIVVVR